MVDGKVVGWELGSEGVGKGMGGEDGLEAILYKVDIASGAYDV